MKKRFFALVAVLICVFSFLWGLCSCSNGGNMLKEIQKDGVTYRLYGYDTGVRRVTVTGNEGNALCTVNVDVNMNGGEPYASDGSDGLDFGFMLTDIDLDGDDDIVITTCRVKNKEKYCFFMNDGKFVFTEVSALSALPSPVFGDGSGKVSISYHRLNYEIEPTPGNPPNYVETEKKVSFGWDKEGKLHGMSGEALIYYSENDVYCLVTYVRDKESGEKENVSVTDIAGAEKELITDTETWIEPNRLAEYGYERFKPVNP